MVGHQCESIKVDVVYPLQYQVCFGGFLIINIIQRIDVPNPVLKVPGERISEIILEIVEGVNDYVTNDALHDVKAELT